MRGVRSSEGIIEGIVLLPNADPWKVGADKKPRFAFANRGQYFR